MTDEPFDLLVVGFGPVGAAMTGLAARHGLDAQTFRALQPILNGSEAIVIRPDHYIYATGPLSNITRLASSTLSAPQV